MPLHYTSLKQLTQAYRHLVLSPHLDDAALSCGSMLAGFAARKQPALVVNICSGSPSPTTRWSRFAEALHKQWALPAAEAMRLRLQEDRVALEILGVDSYQLDLLDAIYRVPHAYVDDATLFGTIAQDDPLAGEVRPLIEKLIERFPGATIYAPLAVGNHVDHQAVYRVAAELARNGVSVAFYEDVPYVAKPGAFEARMAVLGGIEAFTPILMPVDAVALARKIDAIKAYHSQIATVFGDLAAMITTVTHYTASLADEENSGAERLWVRR
ncbi:MAG: PIG-L family deacetylase [Chloroflexia bacterium]|nr:PIG-L family deacetylase [Chloroflexia bacterium]